MRLHRKHGTIVGIFEDDGDQETGDPRGGSEGLDLSSILNRIGFPPE